MPNLHHHTRMWKTYHGDNIKIRSDLSACDKLPVVEFNVKLPDPLKHLLGVLPSIDEMPNYNQQTDANIDILR